MRKWLLLTLILTGCGQTSRGGGDLKFLLPWMSADGTYQLQEVTIETLSSPNELRGEAAEVFSQAVFSEDGFKSSVARPRVTKSGDVYVPMDAESAIAISVYAQFDKLFKYEKQLGSRSQLAWPRRVGIELNMTGPDGVTHNNAHYFTALDVIGLMPSTVSGVPVAVNQGIVAHEHFHAHFQSQVMNVLNQGPEILVSTLENLFYPFFSLTSSTDTRTPRGLNNIVLRAWNEGLADVFASLYTRQSDFFSASLPKLARARDLDDEPGQLMTGNALSGLLSPAPHTDGELSGVAYAQGTVIGRLLFRLANTGGESPLAFQARILNRLKNIPAAVRPKLSTKVIDVEEIVPILLDGYETDAETCAALNGVLMKATMQRSFAKCGF